MKVKTQPRKLILRASKKREGKSWIDGLPEGDALVEYYHIQDPVVSIDRTATRTTGEGYHDWRGRILRGDDATTYMSAFKGDDSVKPGLAVHQLRYKLYTPPAQWFVERYTREGNFAFPQSFAPSMDADLIVKADNQAKVNIVKRIRSAQTKMSGGVFLGEIREAISMIRRPARGLRKGINEYVRNARKVANRVGAREGRRRAVSRALSETWLEHVFGWSPLISDIEDGMNAVISLVYKRPWTFVTDFSTAITSTTQKEADEVDPQLVIHYELEKRLEAVVKYYGVVDLQIDSNAAVLAARRFGFSWQEFIPTVWELIPYSFLVDYFTNIGDVLSATSLASSNVRWLARTERASRITRTFGQYLVTSLPVGEVSDVTVEEKSFSPSIYETKSVTLTRQKYAGSLVPDFQVEFPGATDVFKWLNIAALGNLRRLSV